MRLEPIASPVAAQLTHTHRAITRSLEGSLDRVVSFAARPPEGGTMPAGLRDSLAALSGLLREHMHGEDAFILPALRPRVSSIPYARLDAEHGVLLGYLDALDSAVPGYAACPDPAAARSGMLDALTRLRTLWLRHAGAEEAALDADVLSAAIAPDQQRHLLATLAGHRAGVPVDATGQGLAARLHRLASRAGTVFEGQHTRQA
jgi:hypothetical protein